jgi:hypothetical protein
MSLNGLLVELRTDLKLYCGMSAVGDVPVTL